VIRTARDLATERARAIQAGEVKGGIPTGIKKLDKVIGGLGDFLHIVGGATGGGKSTLLLNMAIAIGEQGGRWPYVWSGEDPVGLTCDRILAAYSGVPAEDLGSGHATPEQAERAVEAAKLVGNWYLDDEPGTAREVLARVWAIRDEVSCFLGDYVQVFTPSRASMPPDSKDHVVEVVRTHAAFSKAATMPTLLGSQFTKEAMNRGKRVLDATGGKDFTGYVPDVGDLHGSGDIMKVSKCILLVNAPGLYNPDPAEQDRFDIYIGKRNFGAGKGKFVRCSWNPSISKVYG
jgi:replicative DNA helicase